MLFSKKFFFSDLNIYRMSVRRRPTLPSAGSHEFPLHILPSNDEHGHDGPVPRSGVDALHFSHDMHDAASSASVTTHGSHSVGPPVNSGDNQDDNEILNKVFILLKKKYEKERERGLVRPVRPDAAQIEYAIHVDHDLIREIEQKLSVSSSRLQQISPLAIRVWMETVGKHPMGGKRKGTKRKGTKRKGTKRKGTKRKGTKRKGTKK